MDPAQDSTLLAGRYQLGSVIGRGGMGTVWRAWDAVLGRDVAVKEIVLPPHLSAAEREAARGRALREAQLAARLRHPNVVGIYDVVEEDGRPWIVMELLQYRSLRDVLREDGPLPPLRAARLGLGILAALDAAHEHGIVHRDVTPGNILISPEGRAVLTDFGIARAEDSPTLTLGTLVGSPAYIAPERVSGGHAGPAADLWALGAVLYAAVEGRAPFERGDALASLFAAVTDEPEPAIHAGSLWPVISGLLRKDPAGRLGPAEAEVMLRRAMRDGDWWPWAPSPGPEPSETGDGGHGAPRWRSRRALGALAATVAATAAAATAFALPQGNSPARSPAALVAGPRPSAPASPGHASPPPASPSRAASSPPSAPASPGHASPGHPSPGTASPFLAASMRHRPKPGHHRVTGSAASRGVPHGHKHHGHGKRGKKGH